MLLDEAEGADVRILVSGVSQSSVKHVPHPSPPKIHMKYPRLVTRIHFHAYIGRRKSKLLVIASPGLGGKVA